MPSPRRTPAWQTALGATLGSEVRALWERYGKAVEAIADGCSPAAADTEINAVAGGLEALLAHRDAAAPALQKEAEALLVALGDLARVARMVCPADGTEEAEKQGEDTRQRSVERVTRKFWVRPGAEWRVAVAVAKYLPVAVWGRAGGSTAWEDAAALAAAARKGPEGLRGRFIDGVSHQDITSVYLDDSDYGVYHGRLRRDDGASLARIRWYGGADARDTSTLYLERKIHKAAWRGERSLKERCPITQSLLHSILAPSSGSSMTSDPATPRTQSLEESLENTKLLRGSEKRLLRGVADFVKGSTRGPAADKKQSPPAKGKRWFSKAQDDAALVGDALGAQWPSVRTTYRRVAFQESTQAKVRVSIDSDLRTIQERVRGMDDAGKRLGGEQWCHSAEDLKGLYASDTHSFPYNIVEVKLQQEDPPAWLASLLSGGDLVAAPKFSKFLHGTSVLNPRVQKFPWWFSPSPRSGQFTPVSFTDLEDSFDAYESKINANAFPHAQAALPFSIGEQAVAGVVRAVAAPATAASAPALGDASKPWTGSKSRSFTAVEVRGYDDPKKAGAGVCLSPRDLFSRLARRRNDKKEGLLSPTAGKSVVRTRVEPKTFFANERTFLSWLQVAVIVLLLGFALLDGSAYMASAGAGSSAATAAARREKTQAYIAARISGALIAPVGILFMLYALWIYRQRTLQILRRETVRYDDQRGPVMLVAALSSSCLLAYVLSLIYAFDP